MTSDNSPSRSLVTSGRWRSTGHAGARARGGGRLRPRRKVSSHQAGLSVRFCAIPLLVRDKTCPRPARRLLRTVAAFLAAEANRGTKVPRPSAGGSRQSATLTNSPAMSRQRTRKPSKQRCEAFDGPPEVPRSARRRPPPTRSLRWWARPSTDLKGLRDRALLLLGFAGAFRRSELVALDVADLQFCDGGLRVTIRKSKTDQEGLGATIAIARGSIACPVDAVRAWIKAAGIVDGPLFRPVTRTGKISARRLSARAVAELVKTYARRAGLKAADFSGHSLRSGFLTSAAARGASIFKMMDVSRHKSVDTLRGYVRDAEMFRNHAGNGLL